LNFIINHYGLPKFFFTSVVGYGGRMLGMEFQVCILNGRREKANKVLCTSSKMTFITDGSPSNLQVL